MGFWALAPIDLSVLHFRVCSLWVCGGYSIAINVALECYFLKIYYPKQPIPPNQSILIATNAFISYKTFLIQLKEAPIMSVMPKTSRFDVNKARPLRVGSRIYLTGRIYYINSARVKQIRISFEEFNRHVSDVEGRRRRCISFRVDFYINNYNFYIILPRIYLYIYINYMNTCTAASVHAHNLRSKDIDLSLLASYRTGCILGTLQLIKFCEFGSHGIISPLTYFPSITNPILQKAETKGMRRRVACKLRSEIVYDW